MIDTIKRTKEIRCAIYTRKSTTEGLEQEFNSLDAQRESCSSYSRLMSQLVARIDHDPNDSTLSITLSPLGLKSFATQNPDKEESEKS